ncbi:MAG: hypothetical protein LV473_17055 [Nitrospira sp.]|nr:hypothetical protein [Nitrospira sp.]
MGSEAPLDFLPEEPVLDQLLDILAAELVEKYLAELAEASPAAAASEVSL